MTSPRATDSPWFWAAVFGCGALASLAIIGPKFQDRQVRLERKAQGREEAWRLRQDPKRATDPPRAAPDVRPRITLYGLAVAAAVGAAAGIAGLWWASRKSSAAISVGYNDRPDSSNPREPP